MSDLQVTAHRAGSKGRNSTGSSKHSMAFLAQSFHKHPCKQHGLVRHSNMLLSGSHLCISYFRAMISPHDESHLQRECLLWLKVPESSSCSEGRGWRWAASTQQEQAAENTQLEANRKWGTTSTLSPPQMVPSGDQMFKCLNLYGALIMQATIPYCLSYFSVTMTKHHNQSNVFLKSI